MSSYSKKNTIISLDVGTDFIKAVLAGKDRKGEVEILSYAKIPQEPGAMRSGVIMNLDSVTESCEKVVDMLLEDAGMKTSRIIFGVPNNVSKSTTSRIHYSRSNPNRKITEEEIETLVRKIERKTEEKAREEISFETNNPLVEVRKINSDVVSVKIDDEKVDDPVGETGSDIVVEYFTSFVSEIYIDAIEKICEDLDLELSSVSSNLFSVSTAIIGDSEEELNFVLIDIGSERTAYSIIRENSVLETGSFDIGVKSAEKDSGIWLEGLKFALSETENIDVVPSRVILCGGGAKSTELQNALVEDDAFRGVNMDAEPTIELLDIEDFPDVSGKIDAIEFSTAIGLVDFDLNR